MSTRRDCLKKKFRSPFRDDDNRPSCRLYLNRQQDGSAYYFLQDFGDSRFSGDCFTVAARILSINPQMEFIRLLRIIDQDLCLGVFDSSGHHGIKRPQKKMPEVNKLILASSHHGQKINFQAEVKEYSKEELSYWERYGILPDVLLRYGVKSLKSCIFSKTGERSFGIYSTALTPMYGYFFNDGGGIKVYRPRSANRFMYAGKLPDPYVFGWEQLPLKGEWVMITGGEKDVLCLSSHGFSAIAFNSETAKIPHSIIKELASRFGKIIFLYDADATGKIESAKRVEELSPQYPVTKVDLPLKGSKKEKDISDFFALGGKRETLLELIKNNEYKPTINIYAENS